MLEKKQTGRAHSLLRHWRIFAPVLLAVILVASAILYLNRHSAHHALTNSHPATSVPGLDYLHLPPGFQVTAFAGELNSPRFIISGPGGVLLVANRGAGDIVALSDPGHTGKATSRKIVVSGLDDPTSLTFYQGRLYVGEAAKVSRFTLSTDLQVTDQQTLINLPTGGQHVTRTVLIGPDGKIYVSIGSTCNVCVEADPHRAAVWVYNLDGSDGHLYARGLRNAVGLAINPWNQQIWATNNGRDYLGDTLPPDTVYALQAGGNYGWPTCHAGTIIDPNMGKAGDCNGVVQPLVDLQAHSAPLGLEFYDARQFPQQYHGLFIAFHGSWNSSIPTGYKVVFVPLNPHGQVSGSPQDFITGWLQNNHITGRPVGLAVGPDGSLYVSDDSAGMIYRVTYQPRAA